MSLQVTAYPMRSAARKGQSLQSVFTAEWYNQQNKAPKVQPQGGYTLPPYAALIRGERSAGTTEIQRFDAVGMDAAFVDVTDAADQDELFETNFVKLTSDSSSITNDNLAIAQEPLPEIGDGGNVIVTGTTWARVYVLDTEHTHVTVKDGRLETDDSGIGYIIHQSPTWAQDAYGYALIALRGGSGSGSNAVIAQSPSGGIPAASAGTTRPTTFGNAECDLIDPETGNVYSPNRTETIYNLVDLQIPPDVIFKAEQVGGMYFIDVASCTPPEDGPVFPTAIPEPN